jgi:hypothetical protein
MVTTHDGTHSAFVKAHDTSDRNVVSKAAVGSNLGRDSKDTDWRTNGEYKSYCEFRRLDLLNDYADDSAMPQDNCALTYGPLTCKVNRTQFAFLQETHYKQNHP